jgi:RNA polymerase sigma factor (sigma-70 family)
VSSSTEKAAVPSVHLIEPDGRGFVSVPSERPPDVPVSGPITHQSFGRLVSRARSGDVSALNSLFVRHMDPLRRWARGRLPRWARTIADTADLVQEALVHTLRRLDDFEPQGHSALQAYLRRAVDNRINDEFRRIARRGLAGAIDEAQPDGRPSPLDEAVAQQTEARYRAALARLRPGDRRLVVGRVELGYSLEQLALLTNRSRVDTARVALRRALERLALEMTRV